MILPDLPPAVRRGSLWLAAILALLALLRYASESREQASGPQAAFAVSPAPTRAAPPPAGSGRIGINTADSAAWERLPGIGPRTARRIVRYRAAVGGFRTWADFRRVYGMDTLWPRVQPYLTLDSIPQAMRRGGRPFRDAAPRPIVPAPRGASLAGAVPTRPARMPVELNTADSLALVGLRGIGPAYSHRILQYRNRLGGFIHPDQLHEIYGWSDSLHQVVVPQLATISPITPPNRLNLNTDPVDLLARHPYLGWTRARRLVAYREQHGRFWDLAQLSRIHGFSAADVDRLRPYVVLD